jgi:hypothetical protein
LFQFSVYIFFWVNLKRFYQFPLESGKGK